MFSELAKFKFPDRVPVIEPEAVEHLQHVLIGFVEANVGPRDPSVTILPPQYFPRVYARAHREGDFARAELSAAAAHYWHITVHELAHELVHVVDGAGRGLNVLEEGAATLFGMAAEHVAFGASRRPSEPAYGDAFDAVLSMSQKPLAVVRELRATHGAMRTATPAALAHVLPGIAPALSARLCNPFVYPDLLTRH